VTERAIASGTHRRKELKSEGGVAEGRGGLWRDLEGLGTGFGGRGGGEVRARQDAKCPLPEST
jgi:hypothetical protein